MPANVLEQMRETFRSEALDLLIEFDSSLLELEAEPGDLTLVHRVFRAIHTIKGSGATAGFAHLARFAHKMEEAFDVAREGRLAVSPELIDCGLKACDVLRLIIEDKAEDSVVGRSGCHWRVHAFVAVVRPDALRSCRAIEAAGRNSRGIRDRFQAEPRDILFRLRPRDAARRLAGTGAGPHHGSREGSAAASVPGSGELLSVVGDSSGHRSRPGGHPGRLRFRRGRMRSARRPQHQG
jgi:HPt (histidine-containing phosphotransfer) domain-containing protein